MAPRPKRGRRGVSEDDGETANYRSKRDKNNEAVKNSRLRAKLKTQETSSRVSNLKAVNQELENKVKALTQELKTLKELFLAYASNTQTSNYDLQKLLADIPEQN